MDSLPSTQLMNIRIFGGYFGRFTELICFRLAEYFSLINKMRLLWLCVCVSIFLNRNRLAVWYFEYRYTNDILNDTTVPIEPFSRISILHIVNDETRFTDDEIFVHKRNPKRNNRNETHKK